MAHIRLDHVSVAFRIYSAGGRSLKNAVIAATTGGKIGTDEQNHVFVQALDDVSFEVNQGDRVALVGHNGAGKTTLLRVLAGIYEPYAGTVTTHGAVAPLFDFMIGSDPEGSGYENIILRGLHMGLSRSEIRGKMDSIAAFTELGEFLDLPVRTYSAGMHARLAFAIATSITPEILLLDETIMVGDMSFFGKAAQRIDEFVTRAGILVLASHSEAMVRDVCTKLILMKQGRIIWAGDVDEGFAKYREAMSQPN